MGEFSAFWAVIWGIGTVISIIAVTVYATRRNTSSIDSLKSNEIAELFNRVNTKMDEKEARKEFVSKELYENQMKHIDEQLGEIKTDSKEILGLLRK